MIKFFSSDPKLLVYGFFTVFFASYGQTFFISIHNSEIRNFYNLTDGQFGFIYALATLLSAFFLVGFAKMIDRIDLRFYSFFISLGLAISCLGIFLLFDSIIILFFTIFGLRFFGQGAMSHAGETTMSRYFEKNRGKALSVSTFGGMLAVTILPIIVVKFTYIFGWNYVWLISSVSILIFFLPIIFLILHDQPKRHSNFSKTINNQVNQRKWRTREVLFDKKFYIFLPITMATPFISTGLTFHQIFIVNAKGWNINMLANGFIFLGMFSILGLIISGPLVDKYNAKKIISYTLVPLVMALLILIFFDNYFFMLLYMCFLGFNIGIGTPILGALWAELYGLESLGAVKALLHASMVFFSAISPLVFGYMIDFGLGILSLSILSLFIIFVSTALPYLFNE